MRAIRFTSSSLGSVFQVHLFMNKFLKEPLLHFLVLGTLLFAAYGFINDRFSSNNQQLDEIVITGGQLDSLITGYEKVWQRLPTQQELEGLVQSYIREEIMYREALAMGLDRNDGIIRRRLQQKLEFLTEDIVSLAQPSEEELQIHLTANPENFRQPSRYSFQHVFINSNQRGTTAAADAQALLLELQSGKYDAESIASAGDRLLMIQSQFTNAPEFTIQRDMGLAFTESLKQLSPGSWQGPIESGFGLHLVFIDSYSAGTVPELALIKEAVANDWQLSQQETTNAAFYAALREKYLITIEDGRNPQINSTSGPQ